MEGTAEHLAANRHLLESSYLGESEIEVAVEEEAESESGSDAATDTGG